MNLENHYNRLWEQSLARFQKGDFKFDPKLEAEEDSRYGVTLLARPSREVRERITALLDEIQTIAPRQYYYPATDLHVTVLSIISCYPGFTLEDIETEAYQKIVQKAVGTVSPFTIEFRGLTASPSCILVQGFPGSNRLEELRNALREAFKKSGLQHSIDKRYHLQTAHITAIRFKKPFKNSARFIKKITALRDVPLGHCTIDQLELLGNDWYQRREKVSAIADFDLSGATR